MVSMDELIDRIRHTVGVKQSVDMLLNAVADRVDAIAGNVGEIHEYTAVIRNNIDAVGGAVAENQRQHPKAEHKYAKKGSKKKG